jgi:hypothetical protein
MIGGIQSQYMTSALHKAQLLELASDGRTFPQRYPPQLPASNIIAFHLSSSLGQKLNQVTQIIKEGHFLYFLNSQLKYEHERDRESISQLNFDLNLNILRTGIYSFTNERMKGCVTECMIVYLNR